MTETAYDRCVDAAKEPFRKEKRERDAAERLEHHREGHKAAARIWFNLLTELWPPEHTERYWESATERLNKTWNENKDNKLLQELLLMTHEYLGLVGEEADRIRKGTKDE